MSRRIHQRRVRLCRSRFPGRCSGVTDTVGGLVSDAGHAVGDAVTPVGAVLGGTVSEVTGALVAR
jgi:hypothetical protein